MKSIATAALAASLVIPLAAPAADPQPAKRLPQASTLAVIGDWPYNSVLHKSARLLIDSINADPQVQLVLHIGDIHSGSMPCTGAGLDPVPAGADPKWNEGIFRLFEQFRKPLVYTPGDNEWTDCHKKKQATSGAPLDELAGVRKLFFPTPGTTLGMQKKRVRTQAQSFDRSHPADAQFVENVMWQQAGVVFVTVHMPGSNNDGLPWTAPFTNETARVREVAQRTGAGLRWLQAAFARAAKEDAKAVLIGVQADMWDPEAAASDGDGLGGYTFFVHELANLVLRFRRPVLLINGDSHVYGADRPLADPASATGKMHGAPAVPNLTRITIQGSTNAPAEWLRLKIDPGAGEVFRWDNVVYCKSPQDSCP
jgi:hypothetical protein